MIRTLSFALAITLTAAVAAAQQGSGISATTPGVPAGTTGTTYSTPGAIQTPSTPGGTVPKAADTQDMSLQPSGLPNYNNSGGTPGSKR